jgi:predicted transcriptional regulator
MALSLVNRDLWEKIIVNILGRTSKERNFYLLLSLSRGAESRRRILKALLSEAKNCSQIAKELKLNWRTVNRHLQILTKENMIKISGFGQRDFYKLTSTGEEAIEIINKKMKKHGQGLKSMNKG